MAEPDLRAEVLAGLDHRIADSSSGATEFRKALRHLREIVEMHKPTMVEIDGEVVTVCDDCIDTYPCRILLAMAPDYAKKEV